MGNPNLDIYVILYVLYITYLIYEKFQTPAADGRLRVITVLLYFCSLQECHYYNLEVKFIQGNSCSRVFGDSAEFYCTAQVLLFHCISEKCRWKKQREVLPDMLSRVRKTPSARQQCWPESFCEKFIIGWRISGYFAIQNIQIIWKVSRWTGKFPDNLKSVWII